MSTSLDIPIIRYTCDHGDCFIGVVITHSGTRQAKFCCRICGFRWNSVPHSTVNIDALPIVADNRPATPCERCGEAGGVEQHHWAPIHLFDDADDWPMGMLCPRCHREWHETTKTGAF